MADSGENYGATSAPLVVNDMVISGTSGGDEGIRGFVSAYSADDRRARLALLDRTRARRTRPLPHGWAAPSNTAAPLPG